MDIPELGIYLHIPFCARKCPYCDFYSEVNASASVMNAYADALIRELSGYADAAGNRTIRSVYIGGGTPSLLPPDRVAAVLDCVGTRFDCAADMEISMEANPGTLTPASAEAFKAAGVNRISLGVQSLGDASLKALGRIHDRAGALKALETVSARFDNFNVDLMHGLPGQTADGALRDLEEALAFNPKHVSWYQLTVEEGTPFGKNPPVLPDDDTVAEISRRGGELLEASGYSRYEVSAFARPGFVCRHNLNYWEYGDYLAAGAGAHSKLTAGGRITRQARIEDVGAYVAAVNGGGSFYAVNETVPAENIPFEYLLNRLRYFRPFAFAEYERRTGLKFADILPAFRKFAAEGLAVIADETVTVTPKGRLFLNRMLREFI